MTVVKHWPDHAHIAGVTEQTENYIQKKIIENLSRFGENHNFFRMSI